MTGSWHIKRFLSPPPPTSNARRVCQWMNCGIPLFEWVVEHRNLVGVARLVKRTDISVALHRVPHVRVGHSSLGAWHQPRRIAEGLLCQVFGMLGGVGEFPKYFSGPMRYGCYAR